MQVILQVVVVKFYFFTRNVMFVALGKCQAAINFKQNLLLVVIRRMYCFSAQRDLLRDENKTLKDIIQKQVKNNYISKF